MRKLQWLFVITCFPWLFLGLCAYLISGYFVLHSTQELDYGEGIVMWQADNVTDWARAYHPVDVYPHLVFEYTPLYHLACRAMTMATDDLQRAGRLVSLLSTALLCVVLALLAWSCQLPGTDRFARHIAAASAGLLFFTFQNWFWCCLMRVDMLGLLFTFSGIALFIFSRRRPALAYGAFLLFVAAVYTKQVMITAPVVCFALLLIENPKQAIRVGMVALTAGLVVLALLQAATHGFFWRNIFYYNQNPFSLSRILHMWAEHLNFSAAVLSLALVMPALFLMRVRLRRRQWIRHLRYLLRRNLFSRAVTIITAFLGLAIAVSASCGKQGAAPNYFLETDFSAILACALFLGWLMDDRPERLRGFHLALTLFVTVLLALHSLHTVLELYSSVHKVWRPGPQYSAEVVDLLNNTPGPVYSEDMTILMLSGHEIPAESAIVSALSETKQWDETSFVQRLAEKRFSAIIVTTNLDNRERYSPNVERSVEDRYIVTRVIGPFRIYTPRP